MTITPKTRRPGGRSAHVASRVHDATLMLLAEVGHAGVTYQAIAERSGVGRATLYRRWPNVWAVIDEAVAASAFAEIVIPDEGSLRQDLTDLLGQIGAYITSQVGRAALAAGLATDAADDPSVGRAPHWDSRWEDVAPIFERAKSRGELPTETDAQAMFAAAAGAIYFRVLVMRRPVDATWVETVVRQVAGRYIH